MSLQPLVSIPRYYLRTLLFILDLQCLLEQSILNSDFSSLLTFKRSGTLYSIDVFHVCLFLGYVEHSDPFPILPNLTIQSPLKLWSSTHVAVIYDMLGKVTEDHTCNFHIGRDEKKYVEWEGVDAGSLKRAFIGAKLWSPSYRKQDDRCREYGLGGNLGFEKFWCFQNLEDKLRSFVERCDIDFQTYGKIIPISHM